MLNKLNLLNKNATLYCCFYRLLSNKLNVNTSLHLQASNVELIQKALGCTENVAVEGLSSLEDIPNTSVDELLEKLDVLQELKVADISNKNFFDLAKLHLATLKNRVMFMQECGFQQDKINPASVKKFLSLTHWNINALKNKLFIEKSTDVYMRLLNHAQLVDHYLPMPDTYNLVALKICRNPFLLWADPDNTMKVIKEIKEIGGIDIKFCMTLYPKIITASYENTKDMLQCLKEFNFSNEAVQRAIFLFTLSSKNVRNRIKELEKEEFFNVQKHNPRVLVQVYYYRKIKLRLQLLREMNVQNASLNQVCTSNQKKFDKYYMHGCGRYAGSDILNYVSSELQCDKKKLRSILKKCFFWRYASLIEIATNLKLLRERGFSDDEIFNHVFILFYENSTVIEELNTLDKKEGLECCKENGVIKKEYILPLIIYLIEKSQNFSIHTFCSSEADTHSDIVIPEYEAENIEQT
ncbi:mitochondrial transcription termination factor 5 isoform X2 [Rhodnius prolixus]|uniref:mitochondrial transcription termination factor 5 isoform X2 n=1 Tax=Rhodnius prolixus TaxID=13249 RepID=UPI003D18C690